MRAQSVAVKQTDVKCDGGQIHIQYLKFYKTLQFHSTCYPKYKIISNHRLTLKQGHS